MTFLVWTAACLLLILFSSLSASSHSNDTFNFIKYMHHAPTITLKPRNHKFREGSTALFVCEARGDPAPVLVWRHCQRRIMREGRAHVSQRMSHSTAAAAEAAVQRSSGATGAGSSASSASSSSATSSSELTSDEDSRGGGGRGAVTTSVLRYEDLTVHENCPVECVAENSASDGVREEALLSVSAASDIHPGHPYVPGTPMNRTVEAGQTVQISCAANGDSPLFFDWFKDGFPLSNSHHLHPNHERKNFLEINNAQESDSGRYECLAYNQHGSHLGSEIHLHVKVRRVPPFLTSPPPSEVKVPVGGTVNVSCTADGAPRPAVRWRMETETGVVDIEEAFLDERGVYQIYNTSTGTATLFVTDARVSTNYTCLAISNLGFVYRTTRFKVQTLPRPPLDVRVTEVTATTARLSWSAPPDDDEPLYYVLQYRPRGPRGPATSAAPDTLSASAPVTRPGVYSEVPGVSSLHYSLRELNPSTRYEIRVVAVNALGRGAPSVPLPLSTLHSEDSPLDDSHGEQVQRRLLVRHVHVRLLSSSTLLVQWDEPEASVTGYRIYYTSAPLLPLQFWNQQLVDDSKLSTISGLTPHQVYWVRVQALTAGDPGPPSSPALVKTQQGVPGPPTSLNVTMTSHSWALLEWGSPETASESVSSYHVCWNDTYTRERHRRTVSHSTTSLTLERLFPGSLYVVWVSASSAIGEGAPTAPRTLRIKPFDVGAPENVRVRPLNTSALQVHWSLKESILNITRGVILLVECLDTESSAFHYQDSDEPFQMMELEIPPTKASAEVTGLQPDTLYSIRVAALVRNTRGKLSEPAIRARTEGGVPLRGKVEAFFDQDGVRNSEDEDSEEGTNPAEYRRPVAPPLRISWSSPPGNKVVVGYRLLVGSRNEIPQVFEFGSTDRKAAVSKLELGVTYVVRVAARSASGVGQDAVTVVTAPESRPAAPPVDVLARWQAVGVAAITWSPPPRSQRGGSVIQYKAYLYRANEVGPLLVKNTTSFKAVFGGLEDGVDYWVTVSAETSKGEGPTSERLLLRTPASAVRAPLGVDAAATSQHSIQVWWEPLPSRGKIIGYQVMYTTVPVDDLDEWQQRSVGLTESVELFGLDSLVDYSIAVAGRTREGLGRVSSPLLVNLRPRDVPLDLRATDVSTHSLHLKWSHPNRLKLIHYLLTWDALKLFVDAQGITQTQVVPLKSVQLSRLDLEHRLDDLVPFTTYRVNLTAVPENRSYRPPASITVTTQMAAPQPMVQPALHGVASGREIQVILPQASEQYGPISHYYLVVVPEVEQSSSYSVHPDRFRTEDLEKGLVDDEAYIAAKFPQRNIPYTFRLGNGGSYGGFDNRPLRPDTSYRIFIRAVVDTPQKHLYTSSPFSEPLSLAMRAVPPGEPPRRPDPTSREGQERDSVLGAGASSIPNDDSTAATGTSEAGTSPSAAASSSSGTLWLVAPVAAAFLLTTLLTLVFVVRKRMRSPKMAEGRHCSESGRLWEPASSYGPHVSTILLSAAEDPVRKCRRASTMKIYNPVPLSNLREHVAQLRTDGRKMIQQEFESIEVDQAVTWVESTSEANRSKHRYANVVAYDHSRVVLNQPPDFINASWCHGYRRRCAYIATQAPLPQTFNDFWRMVVDTRANTIVMVSRLIERSRIKCHQYWPERGTEFYGAVEVTLQEEQHFAYYTIRVLVVKPEGGQSREVRQVQFTAWPDHGVPLCPTPFLLFVRKVRSLHQSTTGPMVVHCSAGVGRSGCFMVADSMLQRMLEDDTVDVIGNVTCLRMQRNYMVQTEEQYLFVYEVLLEAYLLGSTQVPARNLKEYIQCLETSHSGGLTNIEAEFKRLGAMELPSASLTVATQDINQAKNRLAHALPYDHSRVRLSSPPPSDYINASYMDGYRERAAYIATQGPMATTAEHFWQMLWERNCAIVVMLCKLKEQGQEKCHQYWPSERALRYGSILVEPVTEYNMTYCTLREFRVMASNRQTLGAGRTGISDDAMDVDAMDVDAARTVRQFHLSEWPSDSLIELVRGVQKTKAQFGHDGPIIVHCSGGVGRTGVFLALALLLERMQHDEVVDVAATVRLLRTQRPAMVGTVEQYRLVYNTALVYLGSFDHYAN